MRHVFATMGTVASVDHHEASATTLAEIEAVFDEFDRRFSLYRPGSPLSRIADGSLALGDADEQVIGSYARALEWRTATGGAFTPHRPDGVLDLNGLVKAEAIEHAGRILDAAGCPTWTINVGGDILARQPAATDPAPIGIIDPHDRSALLCSVVLRGNRRAHATSGSAERGDHIWRGFSRDLPDFAQVTVLADDIVTADVLATAIVAGGADARDNIADRWDVDVLTVDAGGEMTATPGIRAALCEWPTTGR